MQITQAQLDSFIELYQKTFNVCLTSKQANEKATNLLTLMAAIYKPVRRSTIGQLLTQGHDNKN